MYKYTNFIPENTAPTGARNIGVYDKTGNKVCGFSLAKLSLPVNEADRLYRFGAISDIHLQYDTAQADFQRALTYFNHTEDVDFTCISGDLTSEGTASELSTYKSYVETYSANTPVYAVTGNHDVRNGLQNSIGNYTGQPLYYSFTHGNDVFIMMGVNKQAEGQLFTAAQLQWFYETLEANRNKRCFVFHHVRPQDGCGNAMGIYSYDIWGGTEATVFEALMSHYKNAHQFHGHSHLKFSLQSYSDKANIDHIFGGWSIHVPSLAVPRGANSALNGVEQLYSESEGYVVDVYDSGIHLRGRDFVKDEFLPIASYWLDTSLQTIEANTFTDSTGTIRTT